MSLLTRSSPYGHPEYIKELQNQKRDVFNSYLDNLVSNSFRGAVFGSLVSVALFRAKKWHGHVGLFAGLGAGIATNKVAMDFNQIEQRENRIWEKDVGGLQQRVGNLKYMMETK